MKRLLASLLCATLILSPVGNASTVYATETAEVIRQVQETEEGQQDTDAVVAASEEDAVGASDEQEGKETAAEADETGADSSEADGADEGEQKDESTSGDEAATDVVPSEEEAVTDPEAAEDAGTEEKEVLADDAATSEIVEEDVENAEAVEEATDLLGDEASTCFEVDENGVLKLVGTLTDSATIPADAKVIPAGIFNGNKICKRIDFLDGSKLTTIEEGAFANSKITEIAIPEGVTVISNRAFSGADELQKVELPEGVTSIGSEAFANTKIQNIYAPKVTEIGSRAFASCPALTRAQIAKVVTIGDSAFSGCTVLNSVSLPTTLTSIGDYAFAGCALTGVDFSDMNKYDGSTLTLGKGCFQNNDKLTDLILPNCLKVVPESAFFGCTSLDSVTFGENEAANSISIISAGAFENCKALTTLVFINTRVFMAGAFAGCTGLKTIHIHYQDTESDNFSIAEDAFPIKNTIEMRGYDGKVQDYAETRGYKYVSFNNTKYSIDFKSDPEGKASFKCSPAEAPSGATVRVTVTPEEGYEIKDISISLQYPIKDIRLVENTDEHQVFEFEMKNGPVEGVAKIVKKGDTIKGKLACDFKAINNYEPRTDVTPVAFDASGRESQLIVTADGKETRSWLWNYSSSNTKVATVTNTGIIRTVDAGTATITAALKTNPDKKVSVKISVGKRTEITQVKLVLPSKIDRGTYGKEETIDGVKVPVILFNKSALGQMARNFEMGVQTLDKEGDNYVVTTKWTSTDKGIASAASGTISAGSNTIKVNKGASGETLITVTALDVNGKAVTTADPASFIVRVVDATPRLENSTLTVDSNSTVGTPLEIVEVYDAEIDLGTSIEPKKKVVSKTGSVTYELVDELKVYYSGSKKKFFIQNRTPKQPFAKTYADGNQIYLEGKFEDGGTFRIPVTKLTVTNKALSPTVKATGKINLFYNAGAGADLTKTVTVTQSLKDVEVEKIELVSAANYKSAGSEKPDSFANNFEINPDPEKPNTNYIVTRSDNELAKVGGKNVTSGYVKITYKGYSSPVYKSLTIPTCDTAPTYVLDKASATASTNAIGQTYELRLVDKKTKKEVLSLEDIDTTTTGAGTVLGLALDSRTTVNRDTDEMIFEDIDVDEAIASDVITLKVRSTPQKGKAYIRVKMNTWSRALTYTFTLKTTSALPTVKLSQGTITLNKNYSSKAAEVRLTQNQPEAELENLLVTYKDKKNAGDAQKIIDAMDAPYIDDGVLVVGFNLPSSDVAEATYNFKVTPVVKYGTVSVPCKTQTLKVKVIRTTPTIKWKNSTFKFNAENLMTNESKEVVERTFTIGNLPTGATGTVDANGAVYTPVSGAPAFKDVVKPMSYGDDKAVASILTNGYTIANAGKTLKYKVSKLKVICGMDEVELPEFTISIRLDKKKASMKLKASGSINPLDTNSEVLYTATLSNIVSEATKVVVWEKDDNGDWYGGNTPANRTSKHFAVELDPKKSTVAHLKMTDLTKDGAEAPLSGKKYSLAIVYTLEANNKDYINFVTVTPKQVLPEIKVDKTQATIYTGQADRDVTVKITTKSDKVNVTMVTPEFASGTSAEIKKAFKITGFDQATGVMTVTLANPSAVVQNKEYKLNFVTKYENQAEKSVGNKFTLKVTVKK